MTTQQWLIISHSIGVDLFKSVISVKKKDKVLLKEFYRNYYNVSEGGANYDLIQQFVKDGIMETRQKDYYHVSDLGIEKFKEYYAKMAIYKPVKELTVDDLRHKINFYCDFYNYRFCENNSAHVISAFINYTLKGFHTSHTTTDVIRQFKPELKRFYKLITHV